MKRFVILSLLLFLGLGAVARADAPTIVPEQNVWLATPTFINDAYVISPYGNIQLLNPLYFASEATASALAQTYGGTPVPQSLGLQRFHVAELSPAFVQEFTGNGIVTANDFLALLSLPEVKPTVIKFRTGCVENAGLLAAYYLHNPPDKFPGLADHFVRALLDSDCKQFGGWQ